MSEPSLKVSGVVSKPRFVLFNKPRPRAESLLGGGGPNRKGKGVGRGWVGAAHSLKGNYDQSHQPAR